MHSPRIPLDFDFSFSGRGFHIASGETGMFWFGLLLFLGALYGLWRGLRKGGDFGSYQWIFPPADRDHPMMYWMIAAVHVAIALAGVDLIVAGLYGSRPLVFG